MSKMPAKKKSCFQITSVTQAQVAANNATDDTESLDDPDESRTEDVSSEIFDVSRTDCEPEVCDRSSSEETLNNACEPEGALAPVNGGGLRNPPASGGQQSGAVTNSSSVTSIASCSSRFRVIKLDHGTGEPFRRGRWTCTEYYEKDPEGSVVPSRTVDSIRHANVSEPVADRDSGLGATVVSGMGQTPETSYNGSFSSQAPLEPHTFSVAPPQAVSGSPESFSNKPVPPSIPQQPAPGSSHVAVVHSLLPDGAHQGAHLQKSPSMPAPQVQPLLYQTQPTTHHMQTPSALISASQPDFTQHQMPISIAQAGSSLSVGPAVMPTSSTLATPSTGGIQIVSMDIQPVSYPVPSLPSLAQHTGMEVLSGLAPMTPATSVPQFQASGAMHGLPTAPQSVQNVPTVPATIAKSSMPASSAPTAVPGSAAGAALNPSALNPNGAAVANHADEGRRISDAFAPVPALPSKDTVKPLITEGLQLSNPAASIFGISIPIDGEEDRNPSTVFFQAFQSGSRLKESKMTSDSASGASVVAIDNKIEQAMDLVKSHLMYAVREEVEVLKEQIKELYERNSMLERENAVLKSLANSEQLSQVSVKTNSNVSPPSQGGPGPTTAQPQAPPYLQLDANQTPDSLPRQPQPNVTSA